MRGGEGNIDIEMVMFVIERRGRGGREGGWKGGRRRGRCT